MENSPKGGNLQEQNHCSALWKGEGNAKKKAKSYRSVALLSAMGRLLEGIVAERLENIAEDRGIAHRQVHGFRKGRGVGTGMHHSGKKC